MASCMLSSTPRGPPHFPREPPARETSSPCLRPLCNPISSLNQVSPQTPEPAGHSREASGCLPPPTPAIPAPFRRPLLPQPAGRCGWVSWVPPTPYTGLTPSSAERRRLKTRPSRRAPRPGGRPWVHTEGVVGGHTRRSAKRRRGATAAVSEVPGAERGRPVQKSARGPFGNELCMAFWRPARLGLCTLPLRPAPPHLPS